MITKAQAMKMAEKAGIENWWSKANASVEEYEAALLRLVQIASETERETCAKVCEARAKEEAGMAYEGVALDCAAAIRKRSN